MLEDLWKVIWTDESAFNVGGTPGPVYVTRKASEEYDASCLLPQFANLKLETIHVWGWFCGNQRGPLIFWDKSTMGPRITAKRYCDHILPHLERVWLEVSRQTEDDVYILQDGASVHTAKYTSQLLREKGLFNYLFPWVSKSPDLNLIEGVWRLIKARINARHPQPQKMILCVLLFNRSGRPSIPRILIIYLLVWLQGFRPCQLYKVGIPGFDFHCLILFFCFLFPFPAFYTWPNTLVLIWIFMVNIFPLNQ